MGSVHDVAAYILEKMGRPVSTWKLQKLVYYSQAWSLVWDDRSLFTEPIQAWANGPVCPSLYDIHKGVFEVSAWSSGNPANLDADGKETIEIVVSVYGTKNGQWLSDLTHREKPWLDARVGVPEGERSNNVISHESMAEYYSSLKPDQALSPE